MRQGEEEEEVIPYFSLCSLTGTGAVSYWKEVGNSFFTVESTPSFYFLPPFMLTVV